MIFEIKQTQREKKIRRKIASVNWMSSSSDADIMEHRDTFGPSDEFIKSICGNYKCSEINEDDCNKTVIEEARSLASCTYEEHTKWGEKASL